MYFSDGTWFSGTFWSQCDSQRHKSDLISLVIRVLHRQGKFRNSNEREMNKAKAMKFLWDELQDIRALCICIGGPE